MKLHILIADSGERTSKNLNSLFSMLEDTDFTVSRHTANLNEAVGLVLSRQYDILLCINRAPSPAVFPASLTPPCLQAGL